MLGRDEYKKKKELEERRKAGTAPAELDEDGKAINPHIPEYISKAPWYVSKGVASLKHQRPFDEKPDGLPLERWYQRGQVKGPAATKYRKGACKNCGAITHLSRVGLHTSQDPPQDCTERPRHKGAHLTQKNIKPDEFVEDLDAEAGGQMSYDAKRDRWNGYDPSRHVAVVEEYMKVDAERARMKKEELEKTLLASQTLKETLEEDFVADQTAEFISKPMAGSRQSQTNIRNLRLREDTAKYLRNLDPESAYYDPKTRSMRTDPNPNDDQSTFHGDNFVRFSGDTQNLSQAILFEMQAADRGQPVHLMAMPTQAEALFQEFRVKKEDLVEATRADINAVYGDESEKPIKELMFAQTEDYVEYNRTGKVVSGNEKAVAKSRFEENVLSGNHTTVWGSYWDDGHWGYKCCHQCVRNSYCTGAAGIDAAVGAIVGVSQKRAREEEEEAQSHKRERAEKLKKAVGQGEVGEDEMEQYLMEKARQDDPMAKFK